ncbi:TPA: Arc family DNA-binding protein [Citrobacter freundii]
MYSKYDEVQFHLRLTHELHAKIKQRAKANGRSLNAEIVQIVADSLEKPTPVIGYRADAEREADIVSREIQELVFEKLKDFYRKK